MEDETTDVVTDEKVKAESSNSEKETKEEKASKTVPYNRFKEVNDAFKTAKDEWDEEKTKLSTQLDNLQSSNSKLADVVKTSKSDSDTLNAIRALGKDPKYKDLVVKLDKALQGIEEEEASGDITKKEADTSRKEVLDELRAEVDDKLEDHKADLIITRADIIAKQYLSELPKDYTEADRKVVSEMWANRIKWDNIIENPDSLPKELQVSLESTLKEYGEPRGKLSTLVKEDDKDNKPKEKVPTPAEEMQAILNKNWGETKVVKTVTGKEAIIPVNSDDDFNKEFGKLWRLTRK